jgi:hypothetical protein
LSEEDEEEDDGDGDGDDEQNTCVADHCNRQILKLFCFLS